MPPGGRPKLPDSERRSKRTEVLWTPVEHAALEAAATKLGVTVTDLIREAALRAAKRAK